MTISFIGMSSPFTVTVIPDMVQLNHFIPISICPLCFWSLFHAFSWIN